MGEPANLTPMFRQYRALKEANPDSILLFRMGDFFEMFFEDAERASRLLELTLTARGKGTDKVVPMCGFPHHQLEAYTARLVRADQRVAICEQVEDPKKAKGLVRREVVRTVTPGTVTDPGQLEAKQNVWLCGVASAGGRLGAAFCDLSTGELMAWESAADATRWAALAERLRDFEPREIVHAEGFDWSGLPGTDVTRDARLTEADPYAFTSASAGPLLQRQFGVASLDGFGLHDRPAAIAAAGGLLHYVRETQRCGLEHIGEVTFHEPTDFLLLDPATRRNLELEHSLRDGGARGSLFHTIDSTVTPAGGRLLRRWLLSPLLDPQRIGERQGSIAELFERSDLRRRVRERLDGVYDVERLLTRTVAGTAHPRDLQALRHSLDRLPGLLEHLSDVAAPLLRATVDGFDPCTDVAERIAGALVDDPPASLRDGGVMRDGLNAELDELRTIRRDGKAYIASLEAAERKATGIPSLKVKFNKVFGYFIEVSKPNLRLVPPHYQRKQTIASGERFVTPELQEYESKVLNAQERIESLELELFQELRADVAGQARRLKVVAHATALLDVLAALADVAARHDYSRPTVDAGRALRIDGGRHPVVERFLTDERFVPNDTRLEAGGRAIAVLTGPNMGGKSTYLRQVALIVLLAQTGSFVPARAAEIGVVDRIFCRVGASDSLAEGQSTFMVEMAETANILHHATSNSLLLLDEIGRGTSTFDGLSIAWAVIEHLNGIEDGAPRTLFATHYHELTELATELDGVINLRMAVREWRDDVVFLHIVEEGASDRSYGIQVARLAGVPRPVVARAKEILANIERDEYGRDGHPRRARRASADRRRGGGQGSLFTMFEDRSESGPPDERPGAEVLDELRLQDADRLTPIEALNLITRWKRRLSGEDSSRED
jgi:DNA mismatch repair protein MutS